MKKYFEYPVTEEVEKSLSNYYNSLDLEQHSDKQTKKIDLKIARFEKLITINSNDSILDVGCSRGILIKKIISKIRKAHGIDISKQVIDLNKKNNQSPKITFSHFNGINIEFQSQFDKIFLLDVLEHSFQQNKLLESIYKSLKKDGYLILEVPFTGWLSEVLTKKYHQGHLRYYDPKSLKTILRGKGFKVEKIAVYNSVPYASLFLEIKFIWKILDILVNLMPSKLYPYFGEIIIIAKK